MAPLTLSAGTMALPVLGLKSAISLLCSFHFGYSMRVIAPATMLNFLNLASQNGILVKDGRSLELLNQVDTVVFDKTGTLTLEQPQVGRLYTVNHYSEDELLTYAAAAEYKQTHPIAKAIYIISGDHEKPTQQLAQTLGINHYFAETLPEQKADLVKQLQAENKFVCFIGDGINDSIALKQANTSISMRGATSVATDTAQIVLMDGSLKQLVQLFDLAKNYNRNVDHSFLITLIPTTTAIGGTLFMKFGVASAVIFYFIGLAAGLAHSSLPLLQYKKHQ